MKKEEIENIMKNWQAPQVRSKAESWEMLVSKINETDQPFEQEILQKERTKVVSFRKKVALAVAIAASMIFGVMYFGSSSTTDLHFAEKSNTPVVLPDGSKIWVNADSDISFNENTWKDNREVALTGEGFFEVEKGSSFRVVTKYGEVEVLGTSFNVLARSSFFEVECYTGKVAVTASKDKKILTPGDATRINDSKLSELYTIEVLESDWKNNKFRFVDQSLTQVFEEIGSAYGVEIATSGFNPDIESISSPVVFEMKDLESTLQIVCSPISLQYNIEEGKVSITK